MSDVVILSPSFGGTSGGQASGEARPVSPALHAVACPVSAAAYASESQLRSYLDSTLKEPQIEFAVSLIERYSRIFDREVKVTDGYFGPAADEPTLRSFTGLGTETIEIDPFVGTVEQLIVNPNQFTAADRFQLIPSTGGKWFLKRGDGCYPYLPAYCWEGYARTWPSGCRVGIMARWGFECIPADVTEAVLSMVAQVYRRRDPALAQAQQVDGNAQYLERYTPAWSMATKAWRVDVHAFSQLMVF